MTKVAVIGGGTGTVAVLGGLKKYEDVDLSVIVSMTDDGGSNQVVRDDFGILPMSDLRKSIIALSGVGNGTFRKLFTYRFSKGEGLSGHTLGNLVMTALTEITGSEIESIRKCCEIFDVKGNVIPVTLDDVRLLAKYSDGTRVKGEHYIDEPEEFNENLKIIDFFTVPDAKAYPGAVESIQNADYIIAGPGDLFTSTLANIVIGGIPEAIQKSKGKFIFVNNLMTKMGQTNGMKATDLVEQIEKYSGRKPDFVIQNSANIPQVIQDRYEKSNEFEIEDNLDLINDVKVIREDLLSDEIQKVKGDELKRSLIRHDSDKLGEILYKLIKK